MIKVTSEGCALLQDSQKSFTNQLHLTLVTVSAIESGFALYVVFAVAEEGILKDTDKTEGSIRSQDPPGVVNNTSNIARRANRSVTRVPWEAFTCVVVVAVIVGDPGGVPSPERGSYTNHVIFIMRQTLYADRRVRLVSGRTTEIGAAYLSHLAVVVLVIVLIVVVFVVLDRISPPVCKSTTHLSIMC